MVLNNEKIEELRSVAFVGIDLEIDALMGQKNKEVLKALKDIPNIFRVYEILAPFNLIAEVRAINIENIRSTVTSISIIDGVMATNTIVTTSLVFDLSLPDSKNDHEAKAKKLKA